MFKMFYIISTLTLLCPRGNLSYSQVKYRTHGDIGTWTQVQKKMIKSVNTSI